jgi:DNA repair protein RadC
MHREHDLLHKLSQLKGELTATVAQLLEQQAHAADLQTVIDSYDAQVLAPLAQRLTNAEDRSAAHLQQHQRAHEAHQQALQGLKEENLRLLQEQHQLLDAMADKDVQVG